MSLKPISSVVVIVLVSALLMSKQMAAQSAVESSPAITDSEAYGVYAAVLPRSLLDENHRGPITIQIETAPGSQDCPRGPDYRRVARRG